MAVRAEFGPAALRRRRQPEICWRARPAQPRGSPAAGGVPSPQPPSSRPHASVSRETRVLGGDSPAAKPQSSGKSPVLLGVPWLGLGCSGWGEALGVPPQEQGWVAWHRWCWVRVMLVGGCGGTGTQGAPDRAGGVPRASELPCWVPWGNSGQAGAALGEAKGCARCPGGAKVHVEHLGVRRGPCGASRGEQGPCRVSQGEQSREVPWAEPRAVRGTSEAAG